jgi:predicted SAM-dependent methyltransferase
MNRPKLLNLGCGAFVHEEWTNVDFVSSNRLVIAHDLLKGIPFPDNEFDAVYHSHVLEHFPRSQALPFLNECFRVLKPGGILRVVIPDLESIAREYLTWKERAQTGDRAAAANYDWIMLELYDQAVRTRSGGDMADHLKALQPSNEQYVVDRIGSDIQEALRSKDSTQGSGSRATVAFIRSALRSTLRFLLGKHFDYYALGRFRMGGEIHQWMYDEYSLQSLLGKADFIRIERKTALESGIPGFSRFGFDLYRGTPRGNNSLMMEAVKPEPRQWPR